MTNPSDLWRAGRRADALPVDIRGGAHFDLFEPDTVTLVMHAPHKPFVSVVGDFNGWNSRANAMVTNGSGTWWTTLPYPGPVRYGFYVAIDQEAHVWVSDPYATEVSWAADGPWARLADRTEQFRWTDRGWRPPALRDLVIYELNIRDFAGRWVRDKPHYGDFRDMLARLDYLADLGVNAVELMPIQAFPGRSSWGYNPVFYFAPAEVYGTPTDVKRFVDACHGRGIAVILDIAVNHAWGDHPYYRIYPPMYTDTGNILADWNPFFHHTPPAVNGWGGVDWDHFTPDTTRYFQDMVRFWLQEYHVDGFRFDWACGVEYDDRDPMRPGFDPYHGISALCWAARQAEPDCILIGEYWQLDGTHPDKTAAKLVAETSMDTCWNGEFHHTLEYVLNQRWQWEQRDVQRAIGGFRELGFTAASQVVNYTCNHDEVRPEHEIKFYTGRYIQPPPHLSLEDVALAKALLGLIALLSAPGVPMIYAGQEFGEDSPRTIDFVPLNWDKLKQRRHASHCAAVKRLIRLRRQHPALRSGHIRFSDDDFAQDGLIRYERWDDQGDFAAVALNFGERDHTAMLSVPRPGLWWDAVSGRMVAAAAGAAAIALAPWHGAILVEQQDRHLR